MGMMASQITRLTIVYSTHLFGHRSKQTSKLRVTGLCLVNSPGAGEFPTQVASNMENVSIWWRHHEYGKILNIDLFRFSLNNTGINLTLSVFQI